MNVTDVTEDGGNSTSATWSTPTTMSDDVDEGNSEQPYAIKILEQISLVYFPVVLIVGIVGNFLTIVIMASPKFSKSTSRIYLIALALSDTTLILAQPFNLPSFIKLFGRDLKSLSDVGCKLYFIIRRSSKMTSSWFVVLLCIERFIAVWFPLKAKLICTSKVAVTSIALVYLTMISFTSSWSWASKISENGRCFPDVYNKSNPAEVALFGRMLKAGSSIYSIIPMILLSIFSPLIIYKVSSHSKKRLHMSTNVQTSKAAWESSKITTMLLGIVAAYIILVLPITVLHNTAYELRLNAFANNAVGFEIFKKISQFLEQLNYSINFFLYVLTSQKFRRCLVSLFPNFNCAKVKRDLSVYTNSTKNSSLST
ncbi:hypothetical protein FSP39_004038 [Pinctada imbricata]|uniref:G-protein coupled receptors family 1 profile domain-containing protein n=1 Tax=Pinctada imbricata TaxID=66713 RepID=A0AA89BVM9_PINIB|nr:hypothetical protein FSP39_004038 [Pinctada imbricata]